MARQPKVEPSLSEWAALGLLCEKPSHGWAVAEELAPTGDVGRVHSVSRALTYRALAQLREAGLVETRGTALSDVGPARTALAATRRGRAAFRKWRAAPLEHVRGPRSALMLKLLFPQRAPLHPGPPLPAPARVLSRPHRA